MLGFAKLNKLEGEEYKKGKNHGQHDQNRMLKQTAKEIQESLNISVLEEVSSHHMEVLADKYSVQIHV